MSRREGVPRVDIVGIGGYGAVNLESVKRCEDAGICRLSAAVIRRPEAYEAETRELQSRGVAVYRELRALLDAESPDLVVLSGGIPNHAEQCCVVLESGAGVYCEKPVAGSFNEARAMRIARDRANRPLAIGFQNLFSPSIQRLKTLSATGDLGQLTGARTLVLSERDEAYYHRNRWSGRLAVDGRTVFDSPLQNACSHYLQNMLYIAGRSSHDSAVPVEVYGECYRWHLIESADTQFLRCRTDTGVEIVCVASHGPVGTGEIVTWYDFEHGEVVWRKGGLTEVHAESIAVKRFDNLGERIETTALSNTIEALPTGAPPPLCDIDNSWQHTMTVEALFRSSDGVTPIDHLPAAGLADRITDCYVDGVFPGEAGLPWGSRGRRVTVEEAM